jgi:hypothetical protein
MVRIRVIEIEMGDARTRDDAANGHLAAGAVGIDDVEHVIGTIKEFILLPSLARAATEGRGNR